MSRSAALRALGATVVVATALAAGAPARAEAAPAAPANWNAIRVAGEAIAPGEARKFSFLGQRTFAGAFIDCPVFVAHGVRPGPRLCVTSAIHGDEVNSVEVARRAFAAVDPHTLAGTLIVLPSVNSWGFRTANRYMPDRRDLNRAFPGNPDGSVAAIVAAGAFSIVSTCDNLIDLHTGSNFRTNLPQIRVDTGNAAALHLARLFGVGIAVAGAGPHGSLRREAMEAGVTSIIYEAGPPYVFVEAEIVRGVQGITNVMRGLGMLAGEPEGQPAQLLRNPIWVRVPRGGGGVFLPRVRPGDRVVVDTLLATVADPFSDVVAEIRSPRSGIVVGMALPQVVLSGYGVFHIGDLADD